MMKILITFFIGVLAMSKSFGQGQTFSTGLIDPCPEEVSKLVVPGAAYAAPERLANLPDTSTFLARFLPGIGDQGVQGSCTAFSVAAALTILQNKKNGVKYLNAPLEESKLFSPAFIFNIGKTFYPYPRRNECADGISYIDAFKVVQTYGIVGWNDCKYNRNGTGGCDSKYYPTPDALKKASKTKILTFQRPVHDLNLFKYLLSEGYPINIAVEIDKGYESATSRQNGSVWETGNVPIIGQGNKKHAMLIVGYDNKKGSAGCFRVLDSRGPHSGDRGFLWLSYDLLKDGVIYDAYVCSYDNKLLRQERSIDNSGDVLLTENSSKNSWLKEGYFRTFNDFRIVCVEINKNGNRVVFRIKDGVTDQILVADITLFIGQEQFFEVSGKVFSILLDRFGAAGNNPLKPAVHFKITMQSGNVVEQFISAENVQSILRAKVEEFFSPQDDMIYAGFSNIHGVGSIVSEDHKKGFLSDEIYLAIDSTIKRKVFVNSRIPTRGSVELTREQFLEFYTLGTRGDSILRNLIPMGETVALSFLLQEEQLNTSVFYSFTSSNRTISEVLRRHSSDLIVDKAVKCNGFRVIVRNCPYPSQEIFIDSTIDQALVKDGVLTFRCSTEFVPYIRTTKISYNN